MTWNWLDVVVLLLALGQIAGVIAIAMIALRIKNGPVARVAARVRGNIATGRRLADTGRMAGLRALPHLLRTKDALVKTRRSLRPVTFTDAPVTYNSLLADLSTWGTLRSLARRGMGRSGKTAPRRSVADRLGLLPPAWQKIAPLLGYAGTALTVWKEVQAQLPEIRRRVLAAQAPSEDDTD